MCAAPGRKLRLTDWESGVPIGTLPGLHTRGYCAPETKRKENRAYCEKSDVYSAGIVIRKWMERLVKQGAAEDGARDKWARVVDSMTAEQLEERASVAEVALMVGDGTGKIEVSPTKGVVDSMHLHQ